MQIRCVGKVLRAKPSISADIGELTAYDIAATLERYEFVREFDRLPERMVVQ